MAKLPAAVAACRALPGAHLTLLSRVFGFNLCHLALPLGLCSGNSQEGLGVLHVLSPAGTYQSFPSCAFPGGLARSVSRLRRPGHP